MVILAHAYAHQPPFERSPAALLHRFGKGMAMFIPSTIGHLSLRHRFPDVRLLLRNAARQLARPPVTVEGGDEFVEKTLRRSANGDIVGHLINRASGERPSSGAIPLGPLRITACLPKDAPCSKSARLAMAGRTAPVVCRGSRATFTIPRLAEYEMAVLQ